LREQTSDRRRCAKHRSGYFEPTFLYLIVLSKGPTTQLFEVDSAEPRISGDLECFPKRELSLDSNGQRFESFQLSNGSRDLLMELHPTQCSGKPANRLL
jgi:hypothetical protein